MTRILVSEILCGGGWVEPGRLGGWALALFGEAWAMLAAVAADFAAIPGVHVVALLDERLTDRSLDSRVETIRIAAHDEARVFRHWVAQVDYALIIAPEIGGALERRCAIAAAAGAQLLGPSVDAVRLTSDKLALAQAWDAAGVPTPATCLAEIMPTFPPPWIIKPRFGAGSTGIELINKPADLLPRADGIIQPLIAGEAASVAFLIGPRQTIALPPCSQRLNERFEYLGGSTPLPPDLAGRATAIARCAIDAVAGLSGYVGVDVVLGETDMAIEINPRLTTSYIGLRQLAKGNLAEALLKAARGEPIDLEWRESTVDFAADPFAAQDREHLQVPEPPAVE